MSKTVRYKSLSFMGYPKYRVGDDGSVWSWRQDRMGNQEFRWKLLKGKILRKRPYRRILLCNEYEQKLFLIHRLVLMAFVGPCAKGMQGCHNDNDSSNNHLENLRWDTQSGNQQDRIRHGTSPRGEGSGGAKLTDEKVRYIRHARSTEQFTVKQLASMFNVSTSAVYQVCYKNAWVHVD